MNARAKVIRTAKKLGIKLEYGGIGGSFEVTAEAPKGMHFLDDQVHELVSAQQYPSEPVSVVWADMAGRIDQGLEPCTDKCEWHPQGEVLQ